MVQLQQKTVPTLKLPTTKRCPENVGPKFASANLIFVKSGMNMFLQAQTCLNMLYYFRLDFNTFMITGPNTLTLSVNLMKAGAVFVAGTGIAQTGRCLTDSFSVTNQNTLPVICGDMTGQHGKEI